MKILITGAKGFIGKNLCLGLKNAGDEVFEYDLGSSEEQLKKWVSSCDYIVHLAGINRPLDPKEFLDGNVNFTKKLLDVVKETNSKAPIIFSSSTQASLDNPYGKSKKMAEDEIFAFSKENGTPVYIYRFYNVFGKWCRPNYNSVIATWCFNVAHDIPLQINESAPSIDFVYIDDIVSEILKTLKTGPKPSGQILFAEPHHSETLHAIADALYSFRDSRKNLMVPNLKPGFFKDLYSTYLTYLDDDDFSYPLVSHSDARGSFTEILKTMEFGQISVNIAHPGVTKGNHYHMSKNEKYIVVGGTCEIKLRKVDEDKIVSYVCSGSDPKVVDIPPGFTHCITNIGNGDSITLMWANEQFDPLIPDTYQCQVLLDK
jgi:UDP-2-acetamido-2,6-beta-L-arabino-hexul-4-ose reductase